MRKTFFALALATMALAGCSKDDELTELQPCQVNNTGNLQIRSFQQDPYHIYLNGGFRGTVNPYQSETFTVTAGTYTGRAVQASGFIFFATEYNISVTIIRCETMNTSF